jgi:predicted amidohydrolase
MNDSTSWRVAVGQSDVKLGDLAHNLLQIDRQCLAASKAGCQLLVLPECALSGYCFGSRDEALASSVTLDGKEIEQLVAIARRDNLLLVVGLLERTREKLFNAQVLVGPSGLIGSYRKIHIPHLGVDRFVDPGDRPFAVWEANGARIGLAICYDSSFPETCRVLALQGADIIALSTNWPSAAFHTARIVPPARSMENHLFFLASNRIGAERGVTFCGQSSICGPDGIELARAEHADEALLVSVIDLAAARCKRIERTKGTHVIDRFADRRPQYYAPIGDLHPPYYPPGSSSRHCVLGAAASL